MLMAGVWSNVSPEAIPLADVIIVASRLSPTSDSRLVELLLFEPMFTFSAYVPFLM